MTIFCIGNLSVSGSMVSASFSATQSQLNGLVDGITTIASWTAAPNTNVASCASTAYVEINFGQTELVAGLHYWYYYGDLRVYCNETILLSSNCAFTGEQITVFSCGSNCPVSTAAGIQVAVDGIEAQCVRWISSRNSVNTGIHFIEMDVTVLTGFMLAVHFRLQSLLSDADRFLLFSIDPF